MKSFPTIEPEPGSPIWARLLSLGGRMFAVLFGVAFLVYVGTVLWLHHQWAGKAVAISQASGASADFERSLHGFLPWLLSCALVPALLRLVLEAMNPLRKTGRAIYRLVVVLGISILLAALPQMIRSLRGVDAAGLPRNMTASDPAVAQWFSPDGKATLFWSREEDGSLRFWSRPGVTPDTGVPSQAVTPALRKEWDAASKTAERAAQEKSRVERDRLRAEQAGRERLAVQARERERTIEESKRREAIEAARAERESDAARLRVENALRESREAERKAQARAAAALKDEGRASQVDRKPQPVRRDGGAAAQAPPQTWRTHRMYPGRYMEINCAAPFLEIRTDVYLDIERPGGRWTRVSPGSVTLDNQAHSMRFHCRTRFEHDIQVRPF